MAKTINPEFQAAPFLGESSHDPVEFARRSGERRRESIKEEKQKREASNAAMLQSLLVDVKGWEDQKGFEEIVKDRDKIINTFINFSQKGMNLGNPKTAEEITLYKGIGEALTKLQQKVGSWNQQKGIYDFYMQQINKPGAEETIDIDATKNNIESVLSSKGILERGTQLGNLLVKKPSIDSVNDFVTKNKDRLYQPPVVTDAYVDEQGITHTTTNPMDNPEENSMVEKSYKDLYSTADKAVQDGLKEVRRRNAEQDKASGLDSLTDAEYFASLYNRPIRKKYSEKLSRMGSGMGLSVNVFGRKANITAGEQRDEPLPYGDKTFTNAYKFFSKDVFTVNIGRNGTRQFTGEEWEDITEGGDVEANLLYYDAKDDVFIFRTTQTGNNPYVLNNATISVPRSVFGKEADELPIKTASGEIKKLSDEFGPVKKELKDPFGGKSTWSKSDEISKRLKKR